MTKKLIVVLALVIAVLAVSVNARVVPKDKDTRLNDIKAFMPRVAPADDGSDHGALATGRGSRTVALGVAQPSVASRGHQVTTTWRDYLYNTTNTGQTLAVNPPGNTFGTAVQFTYIYKASRQTVDRARWGYAAYDAVAGVFKAASEVVQDNDPGSKEAGSYPRMVVDPKTGKAYIGSYDFPNAQDNPNDIQLHIVFDAAPLGGLFGAIGDGQRIPDSIEQKESYDPTSLNTIWPAFGMTTAPGDTVMYLSANENSPTAGGQCAVKVFRRDGSVAPTTAAFNPDNHWVLVFKDTSMYPTATLACASSGTKVAVAWTDYTAQGLIDGNEHETDIYYADSPHGLAGTWTKHNVTNYTGDGYRAVLEVNALYDSAGKLHLVWPTATITGTAITRLGRVFHWSDYNPGTIYTVYSYEADITNTGCIGGSFPQLVQHVNIGECDGRLYTVFADFNDPNLTTHPALDDCAKSSAGPTTQTANGDLFVTISKDLQGKSWDKPRNLTDSYTPACDTDGSCADDRWPSISTRGIDDATQPGDWTSAADAKYDPSGTYSGTAYTHIWYLQDHCPGGAVLSTPQGIYTLNDMRWIRLACVQPVTAAILAVSPSVIDFPTFTHPSTAKNVPLTLENTGNATLTFATIAKVEDSCKGPGCGPTGWLNVTGAPATINEASVNTAAVLVLNNAGVITSGPTRLWGHVVWNYGAPTAAFTQKISLVVADTIQGFLFDSIATNCNIKLVVGNNGNMGNNYVGNLNLNFRTNECDTGTVAPYVSRGDATIYLGDASPVVVRKVGAAAARASWSIFSQGFENANGFKPLSVPAPAFKDTSIYQRYFSGEFVTVDSLVKIRKTWYAPKTSTDTCNFVIEKMQVTPLPANTAVTNLLIGEAFDWDVPSDSGNGVSTGGSADITGFDTARRLVWARGFNSADTTTDCWNNSLRYGGSALLNMGLKAVIPCSSPAPETLLYGGYSAANDSFVYPASGFVPEQTWNNMKNPGYTVEPRTTDIHIVLTYKGGATGYTLPANDTLTVYTAMAVTRAAATTAGGLDSLKKYIDKARKWSDWYVRLCRTCCTGTTGNVNMAGGVDLADLSALVSYLTGGGYVLTCIPEANVNHAGGVDLADLSALVSYLTGGGYILPAC